MVDAGTAQKTKTFIVTSKSCIDVVSDALSAGFLDPGWRDSYRTNSVEGDVEKVEILHDYPNERYKDILKNNTGKKNDSKIKGKVKTKKSSTNGDGWHPPMKLPETNSESNEFIPYKFDFSEN
ncbi:MAG: hypothetical protein ABF264_06525 [Flavobacteriales bacterium]